MTLKSDAAPLPRSVRARTVTAVLGPTNTGKTHLAIERMIGHASGVIGLPLRLLAREVYSRICTRIGEDAVALITGEEKIVPPQPRYYVCTVEAMPRETDADFVAIDEVQLAADFERGRVFTDRILNLRGQSETLLLGAATVRGLLERLLPGLNVITRPRMSVLAYAGAKKITRLPARSAVVAFSSDEVYGIAELIRRQRGGAAVVLGALSPRTRNAQVALFQSGEVEFLVATDAIGMGLNLDVDHVAFAANRKFDGYQYRPLTPAELGQIAGRAGRHTRDGTFGVTGRVDPFDDDLVESLENHAFLPVRTLQWRNSALDFASVDALRASLDVTPKEEGLTRAPPGTDLISLEYALRDDDTATMAADERRVRLLWDVCQVPDYRKIAPANHAELITTLYGYLAREGRIGDDWFAGQIAFADRMDGDIDALSNRIAHIRTWTYVANRPGWLRDPVHWQERTRDIEDRLSDALHEKLTQRFVDRRTSVLMRRLREKAMLEAEINQTGDVTVEGQHVGLLHGFRFTPDPNANGSEMKALRAAAQQALASEIVARAERLEKAPNEDIVLTDEGALRWRGELVGRLAASDDVLKPQVVVLADEQLNGAHRDMVQKRLDLFTGQTIETLLKPLVDLRDAADITGLSRGIAFRLVENLGTVERPEVAEDVRQLDQEARAVLRRYGVRFGAYHIYLPALLKPAPSRLIVQLWALKNADDETPGLVELPQLSASGRTSVPVDKEIPATIYRLVGFKPCGERAVRIDILERLADLTRPLIGWRPNPAAGEPPEGAIPEGGGFTVTVAMTSLLGCSGEDFASILTALGYRRERRTVEPQAPKEPSEPAAASDAPAEETAAAGDAPGKAEGPATEAPSEAAPETPEAARTETPAGETAAAEATEPTAPAEETATDEATAEKAEPASADTEEPAEPAPDTATPEEPAAAEEAAAESAEPEPAPADATSEETASAEGTVEAAAEAPSEPAAEAAPASEEPQIVEIWRPSRGNRHGKGKPGRHRGKRGEAGERQAGGERQRGDGPEGAGDGKGARHRHRKGKPGGGGPNRGGPDRGGPNRGGPGRGDGGPSKPRERRPEKQPDPDSPFAALAALKKNLEKQNDKG
ncbi:helicase-related protein [Rhodobium gokarnense]|uniref:ATP-dependent RNA helicase SUPV3L1/SUV3 n=1 Tax=Rhodobium gokarnense TaxID=364296 RepID=A0ABT3H9Q9_9HYPH|nr:helicase-related protein [Rhodobium gokarnense]MCW2307131.1 ATP-dependent RNA helicase SUPV3L1/SUV3 [Rhodobium gokarnense]